MLGVTGPTGPVTVLVSVEAWDHYRFSRLEMSIY